MTKNGHQKILRIERYFNPTTRGLFALVPVSRLVKGEGSAIFSSIHRPNARSLSALAFIGLYPLRSSLGPRSLAYWFGNLSRPYPTIYIHT